MIPVGTKVWVMGRVAGKVSGYGTVEVEGKLEQVYIVNLKEPLPTQGITVTDIAASPSTVCHREM